MDIILLQKVANLGNIGDRVKVKSGFGRNYLLPQGKATVATPDNIKRFEARRTELEKAAHEHLSSAEQRAEALKEFKLVIPSKAGTEGKLFGSIGTSVRRRHGGGDVADRAFVSTRPRRESTPDARRRARSRRICRRPSPADPATS